MVHGQNGPPSQGIHDLRDHNSQRKRLEPAHAGSFFTILLTFYAIGCIIAKSQKRYALVAQLDRVSDYESEGLGFESLRAHHSKSLEISTFQGFSYLFKINFTILPISTCIDLQIVGNYHCLSILIYNVFLQKTPRFIFCGSF